MRTTLRPDDGPDSRPERMAATGPLFELGLAATVPAVLLFVSHPLAGLGLAAGLLLVAPTVRVGRDRTGEQQSRPAVRRDTD